MRIILRLCGELKMSEIVIKNNKKKFAGILVLGSIMLFASIFVLFIGISEKGILEIILGTLATVFFGAAFIFIVKSNISDKPLLVIGEQGITDMSTACSVGFIAWEEIKSIYVEKSCGQKFIGITIYDLNKLIDRISPLKKVVIKANLIFKYAPVAINLSTADMDFDKALALIQEKLESHRIGFK